MNRLARLINPPAPRRAMDTVADVTRTVWEIDDLLADAVRQLDRPTQPTNVIEDEALRTLRRAVLHARIALGRVPR